MPPPSRPSLEQLELHVWQPDGRAFDLSAARTTPRKDVGAPLLDVGLLARTDPRGAASARSVRIGARVPLGVVVRGLTVDGSLGSPPQASVQVSLQPLYRRAGLVLARARGAVDALGESFHFDDAYAIVWERRGSRRPYAWSRAVLRGAQDGLPIVCIVETARRRAGSVVLPELGRMWVLGPGARALPRGCTLAALPLRAEYGTGRLRATALGPGVRASLELEAPPSSTAVFEVVDPSGEAAYAHRALGATARLRVTTRAGGIHELALDGRYEWGARAGDPRVALRAWRG